MSKVKFSFNGTDYSIDESVLSQTKTDLKNHLSTTMNGSGATINFDGVAYSIDSTKLSAAVSNLEDAIASLIGESYAPGLYRDGILITSWDELVTSGNVSVRNGRLSAESYGPSGDLIVSNDAGATIIGQSSFRECAFTSITVPNSVTTIEGLAFYECYSLVTVNIPSSITSIGTDAFNYCENLSNINYEGTVSQWTSLTRGVNVACGIAATHVQCSDGQVTL